MPSIGSVGRAIAHALRVDGATVRDISDANESGETWYCLLLVGYGGRNWLFYIHSDRTTNAERQFLSDWRGEVHQVSCITEAQKIIADNIQKM